MILTVDDPHESGGVGIDAIRLFEVPLADLVALDRIVLTKRILLGVDRHLGQGQYQQAECPAHQRTGLSAQRHHIGETSDATEYREHRDRW